MKEIKTISEGKNYTAVSVGNMDGLHEFATPLGGGKVSQGKVFIGAAMKTTGSEISFQHLNPGEGSAFLHSHKQHEELYIIVKGKGEYQVDGEVFPVAEGSVIRVAPEGVRALRNNGTEPMVMICVQYKADSFGKDDDIMTDGNISDAPVKW